jgi:large subunit ribosomal protein L25
MSSSQILKAKQRKQMGSRHARSIRLQGGIPATVQPDARKTEHLDIAIDETEFLAARRHHVHLFDLDIEGKTETAVVRELQWDTFGERILHVEFKRVQRGVKTEANVELEFVGHPKHGVVNHLVGHITILADPTLIPDAIEVRVGDLDEGSVIHARDLILPDKVELAVDPDLVVATIAAARADVIEVAAEVAPEAAVAQPDVEKPKTE